MSKIFSFYPQLLILFILLDIFIIKATSVNVIILSLSIWVVYLFVTGVEAQASLYLIFILLTIIPLDALTGDSNRSDKAGVWVYLILISFFFNYYLLYKLKRTKTLINAQDFWRKLCQETNYKLQLAFFLTTATVREIIEKVRFSEQEIFLTSTTAEIASGVRNISKTVKKLLTIRKYLRTAIYAFLVAEILLLVQSISKKILDDYQFYNRFFVDLQWQRFVNDVGLYFLVADITLLLVLSSVLIFIKARRRYKFVFIYLTLFSVIIINNRIFDIKTKLLRNKVIIWSITPSDVTDIWVDVTVRGRNFKDNPNGSHILIDGVEQRIILWAPEEVIFRTNPTITKSGGVQIIIDDKHLKSNTVPLKYHPVR